MSDIKENKDNGEAIEGAELLKKKTQVLQNIKKAAAKYQSVVNEKDVLFFMRR